MIAEKGPSPCRRRRGLATRHARAPAHSRIVRDRRGERPAGGRPRDGPHRARIRPQPPLLSARSTRIGGIPLATRLRGHSPAIGAQRSHQQRPADNAAARAFPRHRRTALASAASCRRRGCAGTSPPSSHKIRNPTTVKNSGIFGDILPSRAPKGAQRAERGSKRVETASLCLIYNGNDTLYVTVSLNILSDDKISPEIAGFFTIEGRGPRSKSNQGPKSKRRIRHRTGFATTLDSPLRRIRHRAAFAAALDSPPRRIRRRTGTWHGAAGEPRPDGGHLESPRSQVPRAADARARNALGRRPQQSAPPHNGYLPAAALRPAKRPNDMAMEWLAPATVTG